MIDIDPLTATGAIIISILYAIFLALTVNVYLLQRKHSSHKSK
jgi:uncharacterized membrane protein